MRLIKIMTIFFIAFYFVAGDLCAALSGQKVDLVEMQKKEKERRKKLKDSKTGSKHTYTDEDLKKIKDKDVNITEIQKNKEDQVQSSGEKRSDNTAADSKQEVVTEPVEDNTPKEQTTSVGEYTTGIQTREKVNLDVSTGVEGQASQMTEEDHWRGERKKMDKQVEQVEAVLKQEEDRYNQLHNNLFINTPDLVDEQQKLKQEMEESQKRIAEYKGLLEQAKKLREDFYDAARREGIPPGWLRD